MSRSGGRAYPGWHARSNTGSACGSRSTRPFPPSPPPRPSVNGLVSRRRSLSRLLLHTRRVPKRERAGCRARVGILEIRACALASLALRAGAEVERAGLLAQGENVTVTAPIKFHFLPVIGAQRPEGKTSGEQGAEGGKAAGAGKKSLVAGGGRTGDSRQRPVASGQMTENHWWEKMQRH